MLWKKTMLLVVKSYQQIVVKQWMFIQTSTSIAINEFVAGYYKQKQSSKCSIYYNIELSSKL